ncbi:hypothetical protein CNMCM6106_000749 [Aspergillus hiratsukae]|uniref:Secreted protein CSS2 C-terminal domain-containing protein n=1 Tax=Aspergillus hiratsukae TaxID=1194566 RepID=A0A8H6PZC6_9EURO|nr:hypothetical protein CNMCM6106_000749 [Aspergillus hiratsukae]
MTNPPAMPDWYGRLLELTRLCCLFGLVFFNRYNYYVLPAEYSDRDSVLLWNFRAGLFLAFIYPGATAARQMVSNEPRSTGDRPQQNRVQFEPVQRTPVTSCLAVLGGVLSCITIGGFIIQMCQYLAGGIKALSDQHSCSSMSGTIEGVRFTYHSTGQHCDTTAQRDAIAGAIKKFVSNVEHDKICGTLCLRLDHGGTWNGWLKLGPVGSFNENAYCGSGLPFNSCVSGGNNDI